MSLLESALESPFQSFGGEDTGKGSETVLWIG